MKCCSSCGRRYTCTQNETQIETMHIFVRRSGARRSRAIAVVQTETHAETFDLVSAG